MNSRFAPRRWLVLTTMMLAITGLVVTPARADDSESTFSFESDSGEYVGKGGNGTLTSDDVTFTSHGTAGQADIRVDQMGASWYIRLAAPTGSQLTPGTYTDARRWPATNHPGLDVSGNGNGCNATFGNFTVRSISADATGRVTVLDATFEQHCERATAPALRGTLRYRAPAVAAVVATSSNPSTVEDQPVTFTAVVDAGSGGTPTGKVKFREGTTALGSATVTGGLASFTTDDLAVGTHSITAHYSGDATHAAARSAAVQQSVLEGETSVWYLSTSGDHVGRGGTASYTPESATVAVQALGDGNEVQLFFNTAEGSITARFAAPQGSDLEIGAYEDAVRAPFHAGDQPGLSFSAGLGTECGSLTGRFEVHDVGLDIDGNVLLFDASFSQACDSTPWSPLVGRVRYFTSTRTTLSVPWSLVYGAEDASPFDVEVTTLDSVTPAGTVAVTTENGELVCTATLSGGTGSCTLGATQLLPGAYWVSATYTPSTPGLESSSSEGRVFWVDKAPTRLVVDSVRATDIATTRQVTYRATLTSRVTNGPLAGEVVTFSPNYPFGVGGEVGGCQATTDASGVATCSVDAAVGAAVPMGFHASYAGSATYHPTTGNGAVTTA